MRDAFESWVGKEVVLQLGFGLIKVRLRGILFRSFTERLFIKSKAGPNIEIAKTKVLAIEEVERGSDGLPGYVLTRDLTKNSIYHSI